MLFMCHVSKQEYLNCTKIDLSNRKDRKRILSNLPFDPFSYFFVIGEEKAIPEVMEAIRKSDEEFHAALANQTNKRIQETRDEEKERRESLMKIGEMLSK